MIALRLALRDLRGGLVGLRLLALCLFLGVAALAGVGSLSSAVQAGLSSRGQEILGGDIEVEMAQREASPDELAVLHRYGAVSETTRMRAMAAAATGGAQVLVELKGVDDLYPLYGALRVQPGAQAPLPRGLEVALAQDLGERLGVRVGGSVRIGAARLRVVALIADEPDRISQGFAFGPTAIVDRVGLAATGLVQPGSLYTTDYRLRLSPGTELASAIAALHRAFPDVTRIKDRDNAAPGTERFLARIGEFLTLLGLAALAIAGIGVGNGVTAMLERKRGSIAALKMLGASGGTIFLMALAEIGLVALAATLLGLAAGAAVPSLVVAAAGDALPVSPELAIYPEPLALAAFYGLVTTLVFALIPLARARRVPAATLFRAGIEPLPGPGPLAWIGAGVAAAALAGVAIEAAPEPFYAIGFIGGTLALLGLLAMIGVAVRWIASRVPRPREPVLRLALANLHRPGSMTARLVVALGLGFSLFTALAVIQSNLTEQIRTAIPARAPSYFLLDVPSRDIGRFLTETRRAAPHADVLTTPVLRGTVVALAGRRVADMTNVPESAWFVRGDRSMTYAAAIPDHSHVVEGRWWPADYRGPPLVSLAADAARAVGLHVGDTITIAVLGREIEARIASLREIDWGTLDLNFVIIFAPGTLESAPHTFMGSITLPPGEEARFAGFVAREFPNVTSIRVKDVVESVGVMMGQLAAAVRWTGAVAVLAGIAVLVGAVAASRRARTYDAVLLKLLGATRGRILAGQAIEFALLALILCVVALVVGAGAGWYVVVKLFELHWGPDWSVVAGTLGLGAFVTIGVGLLGALPALAARPAAALRTLQD